MNINLSFNAKNSQKNICKILEKNFKINILDLNKAYNSNKNKTIFILGGTKKSEYLKIIKTLIEMKSNKTLLISPNKFKEIKTPSFCGVIFYPIDFSILEKEIKSFFYANFLIFNNVILDLNGKLINKESNKSIFITEAELKILNCLFLEKKVKKNYFKLKILNFQETVETKSLESHLTRIRKKIIDIDGTLRILSEKSEYLSIS